jgi:hypothetical protein
LRSTREAVTALTLARVATSSRVTRRDLFLGRVMSYLFNVKRRPGQLTALSSYNKFSPSSVENMLGINKNNTSVGGRESNEFSVSENEIV